MLAPITHILPHTNIRRLRLLPKTGQVEVREGQYIEATDVVATTNMRPEYRMLNIALGLGVDRDTAERYIDRKEGEKIYQNDVIARIPGVLDRVVRSPVDGKLILFRDGLALIEEKQRPYYLFSGLPGTVVALIHERGAVIETTGGLVQGVWGNDMIDSGKLTVAAQQPDDLVTLEQIEEIDKSSVLLSGRCESEEVLRKADDKELRGLVFGSMSSHLIPTALEMTTPVFLTDGFGRRAMNPLAFELLTQKEGVEVAVNAEPRSATSGTRPELVLPPTESEELIEEQLYGELAVGQIVRITRAPYQDVWGTISAFEERKIKVQNGLRVPAARVKLEAGDSVHIPLANLEVFNAADR